MNRNGMPEFYNLLEQMAEMHDKKSHDYASNDNPAGNYHFAGQLSKLFDNPDDAGFIGRIGEKLYRLANLENGNKIPKNESIKDTEKDICVITVLWMADRQNRRYKNSQIIEKPYMDATGPIGGEFPDVRNEYVNKEKPLNVFQGIIDQCSQLSPASLRELSDYCKRYANDKDCEKSKQDTTYIKGKSRHS